MTIKNMGSATMRFNEGIIVSGSTDAALSVYHNQSNSYATTIDNDQSSSGHVLKLSTDGNGTNTNVLEMEDGDGDVIFRARADGRFGFGPDGVDSMGAGTFVVGIDNSSHTADIAISKRLQHLGDGDTYLDFANDKITLKAGNKAMVTMEEKGSAPHEITLNDGGNNIDLVVKGNGSNAGNPGMFFDASNNRVGINGVGAPSCELDVAGDIKASGDLYADKIRRSSDSDTTTKILLNDELIKLYAGHSSNNICAIGNTSGVGNDNNFWVSGSINSQGTSDSGTAVFGGDVTISGSLHDSDGRHITANELISQQMPWTVAHDGSPGSNGSLLYMTPSYMPGMAMLVSAESNAQSWSDYSGEAWVTVMYNSNPVAMGAMQIYFDHDATDDDKKFMVNTAAYGGMSFTIPTSSGRLINVVHDANASSVGVPLYFDMQAASARTRVIADLPGDTASSTLTSEDHAFLFKAPHE